MANTQTKHKQAHCPEFCCSDTLPFTLLLLSHGKQCRMRYTPHPWLFELCTGLRSLVEHAQSLFGGVLLLQHGPARMQFTHALVRL